jgi:hypothetical protein
MTAGWQPRSTKSPFCESVAMASVPKHRSTECHGVTLPFSTGQGRMKALLVAFFSYGTTYVTRP